MKAQFKHLAKRLMSPVGLSVLLLASGPMIVDGAAADVAALRAEYDALFHRMLRDPGNLDLIFRFAEVAIALENYEAAVTALERLLLFNPDLPRVQLELGVLYFRLGSFELSRGYFDKALSYPDTPPKVRERVAGFMAELDRRTSPHKWSGTLTGGLRWQSNANTGIDGLIRSGIIPGEDVFEPSSDDQPKADLNFFAQASMEYAYDLGTQHGDALIADFTGYGTFQRHETQLNVGYADIRVGPRFAVAPTDVPGWTVRPYLFTNGITLDTEPYSVSGGFGVETRVPVGNSTAVDLVGELDRHTYFSSGENPTASEQTGGALSMESRFLWALGPKAYLILGAGFTKDNTVTEWNSSMERRLSAAVSAGYSSPLNDLFGLEQPDWRSSLAVAREWENYDGADPSVDPTTVRHDRTWRVTAVTSAALSDRYGLVGTVQRVIRDSDISNYRYDNWLLTVGVSVKLP